MKPKIINTEILYSGRAFNLSKAKIEEAGVVYEREIVEHRGSAVVLPMHKNGEITLVKQYRHPAAEYLLEIPAGTVEKGETPAECAAREIEEETGFRARELRKISEFFVSPGFLTEKMHLFLASNLIKTEQNMDFDENIEPVRLHLDEAARLVSDGSIIDAKTIIGILLVSSALRPSK